MALRRAEENCNIERKLVAGRGGSWLREEAYNVERKLGA